MNGIELAAKLLTDALFRYEEMLGRYQNARGEADDMRAQNKRLSEHHTELVKQLEQRHQEDRAAMEKRHSEQLDALRRERQMLLEGAQRARELLREWLGTPYFKTRAAWKEWADDFRARVLGVL